MFTFILDEQHLHSKAPLLKLDGFFFGGGGGGIFIGITITFRKGSYQG